MSCWYDRYYNQIAICVTIVLSRCGLPYTPSPCRTAVRQRAHPSECPMVSVGGPPLK